MSTSSSRSTATSPRESSEPADLESGLDELIDEGGTACQCVVDTDDSGLRLDLLLARVAPVSRSQAANLIAAGRASVNGRLAARSSLAVRAGDVVRLELPEPEPIGAEPEAIALDVAYEDSDVIVVNKPPGLVVHPAPGHATGTLVNALLHHCGDLSGIGGALRPGIVHRIDRDTSGLIVATKNDVAHAHLQAQFAAHTVDRQYVAIAVRVRGSGIPGPLRIESTHDRDPTDRRRFAGNVGGKRHAVTNVEPIEVLHDGALLVRCRLETGRTHQIRMHLSELGCPLLGDPLYGGRAVAETPLIGRTALHAALLGFELPGGTRVLLRADPPTDFSDALGALRSGRSWRR